MPVASKRAVNQLLHLDALTAADLMNSDLVSIREDATINEAMRILLDEGFSGAPVIDKAGRPVGVVSRTDLLVHDRENPSFVETAPEYYAEEAEARKRGGDPRQRYQVVHPDTTRVSEIMTPVVFAVAPSTPAKGVVSEMLTLRVHRIFVVDQDGTLIGVISGHDILRRLV